MIQCQDCEFFHRDPNGRIRLSCDPFSNVKEPDCLQKWQLLKSDQLVQAYQTMLAFYHRLSPLQEKMLKLVQREVDDIEDSEGWKTGPEDQTDL